MTLIIFCVLKPGIIYVKYEGSMINHIDRRGNYREIEKWLPFKKVCIGHIDSIFPVHILAYIYICTYMCEKSFIIKRCGQEDCPQTMPDDDARRTIHHCTTFGSKNVSHTFLIVFFFFQNQSVQSEFIFFTFSWK